MAFREVINYSHNLISGQSKAVKKNKEMSNLYGKFKVEMFDALTGRKTYEAKSANRITAVLSNVAYMDCVYNTILNNSSTRNLIQAYNNGNSYAPNKYMLLTDGNIEENPYDPFIYGNVVGYADLWNTYSGSSNFIGTINTSETTKNGDTKHFVVDFPTNAANGTFNSIYTVGGIGSSLCYPRLNSVYYDYIFAANNKQWKFDRVNICIDDNIIYALKVESTTVGKFNKMTMTFIEEITLAASCKAISYDRVSNIWGLSSDGKKVYKFAKDTLELLQTIELSSSCYFTRYTNSLDISVNEGFIYVINKGYNTGESTTVRISKVGKDGTFVKSLIIESSADYYVCKLKSGSEILAFSADDKVYIMDMDLNINFSYNAEFSIFSYNSNGTVKRLSDISYDVENGAVYSSCFDNTSSSYNYLMRGYFVPALSHTLLPEAITKTPTNTMKIQYDITVERVGAFAMPPH